MKNMCSYLISFLFLPTIFLLSITGLQAQISIGINAGPSFSTLSYGEDETESLLDPLKSGYIVGYFVSVPIEFTLSGPFALQAEVNFHQKGIRMYADEYEDPMNSYTFEGRNTFNYVQTPLLLKFKMGEGAFRASIYAGPSVSFLTSGESYARVDAKIMGQDFNNETQDDLELEEDFNRWEFSALVGVGLELDAGPGAITFDSRYQQGFSTLTQDVELEVYNRGFTSALGYKIRF